MWHFRCCLLGWFHLGYAYFYEKWGGCKISDGWWTVSFCCVFVWICLWFHSSKLNFHCQLIMVKQELWYCYDTKLTLLVTYHKFIQTLRPLIFSGHTNQRNLCLLIVIYHYLLCLVYISSEAPLSLVVEVVCYFVSCHSIWSCNLLLVVICLPCLMIYDILFGL